VITKRGYEEMERRATELIEEAVRYCEKECTDPDPADVLRGVYSQV
jgi:TPP-dependent pyruvate/acetoin dehydrogenase alpha subunit